MPEFKVTSELLVNYNGPNRNRLSIDIVIEIDGQFYPIELKFKTCIQVLPSKGFNGNPIILEKQGAYNIGCYDFWKDAHRGEFLEKTFNVNRCILLFVSNDLRYLEGPINEKGGYANFSIEENRKVLAGNTLTWIGNLTVANGRNALTFNNDYHIHWAVIPHIEKHQYILC